MGIENFKNYYYKKENGTPMSFSDYLGALEVDYGGSVVSFPFTSYKNTTDTSEVIKIPLYSTTYCMSWVERLTLPYWQKDNLENTGYKQFDIIKPGSFPAFRKRLATFLSKDDAEYTVSVKVNTQEETITFYNGATSSTVYNKSDFLDGAIPTRLILVIQAGGGGGGNSKAGTRGGGGGSGGLAIITVSLATLGTSYGDVAFKLKIGSTATSNTKGSTVTLLLPNEVSNSGVVQYNTAISVAGGGAGGQGSFGAGGTITTYSSLQNSQWWSILTSNGVAGGVGGSGNSSVGSDISATKVLIDKDKSISNYTHYYLNIGNTTGGKIYNGWTWTGGGGGAASYFANGGDGSNNGKGTSGTLGSGGGGGNGGGSGGVGGSGGQALIYFYY